MAKTKKRFLGIGVLAAIAVITFAFAIAASGSDGGVIEQNAEGVTVAASEVTSCISYQGRLADSEGEPLSGTYSMTFSLYEVVSRGTVLDTDSHSVVVTGGLFNTDIDLDQCYFDGRELWLGVAVGTDSEMTPRQELRPVPYALSLKPGARIDGSVSGSVLKINNTEIGAGVHGVYGETSGNWGWASGVYGKATKDYAIGVTGRNTGSGAGVYGWSDEGPGVIGTSDNDTGMYGMGKYGGYFTSTYQPSPGEIIVIGEHGGVMAETDCKGCCGVFARTTGHGSHGVIVNTDGDISHGVSVGTYGDNSRGVSAYSEKANAIYASTGRSDNKYGVKTPDKMCAMSYDTGWTDVAEYFPTPEDPEPGTVMVIDPAGGSKLRASAIAYDTTVAGIVSTAPGVSLGTNEEGNEGENLIAVAGRVSCKVDATYAPIMPGDLLTTSDTPGHAMKAQPVVIGGVEIYRPGTTLGKALEPFDSGTGVIEVLVTLQ